MLYSVWIALGLTFVLMALGYATPYIRRFPLIPEKATASFSGGVAVAYVFLHLLPGIVENKETIGALLDKVYIMTPLKDLAVYIMGLAGFLLFFGLNRMAQKQVKKGQKPSKFDFYLHLASLALYNGLITFTMPIRVQTGLPFAILFTLAMGFHFVILDRSLEKDFPDYFDHQGRRVLMGVLFLGWILAFLTEPENIFIAALLNAFLGGSILMNVFKNELPSDENSSFGWFTFGTAFGTALLLIITILEKGNS